VTVPSDLERIGREAGVYFTAADLMNADFPEPKWAVPGLVAEGLLVGAPKFGKSWLCLGLAVAVSSGGRALGKIAVEQGAVLYAALEDPPRRLQNRINMVLGDSPVPDDLHVITMLPRLPVVADFLAGWLDVHQNARLVIVDVLRKVRPLSDGKGNAYNEDYDTLALLKDLADKYGVAVVVVHHTRKMTDDADVLNEVSGSTGLTGAADAILIAKRARNTADAVLHLTGRDVTEREFGMKWDAGNCMWTLLDEPVALATMGATRRTILTYLTDLELSTPQQIATGTGLKLNTVQVNVRRMVTDDQLDSDGEGRYLPRTALSAQNSRKLTPLTRLTLTSLGLVARHEPPRPTARQPRRSQTPWRLRRLRRLPRDQ
jgi:nucleotide-binding universal stress UspA family protein